MGGVTDEGGDGDDNSDDNVDKMRMVRMVMKVGLKLTGSKLIVG